MARTPEVAAKDAIKKRISGVLAELKLPHKLYWNAGASIGTPRIDFDGVIAGHAFYIEVKRFDGAGVLNARQRLTLRECAAAGAFTMVIDSPETLEIFVGWIRHIANIPMINIAPPQDWNE